MEADLYRIYELEQSLLDMQEEEVSLKISIAQGSYDLRSAKAAVLEYGGSVRSFLDGFRGTREAKSEQLQKTLRHAQDALMRYKERQKALSQDIMQAQAERSKFPALADLPQCRDKNLLEARLCLHVLDPMLDDIQKAMLDCRDLEQGRQVGEVLSIAERQEILSKPVNKGRDCASWLQRLEIALEGLDIPFSIPEFYKSPAAYLAVTQNTRRDRLNMAIDQTVQLKKQIAQLKNRI